MKNLRVDASAIAALVDAALDWPVQRADFEPDGSLLDIYVLGATMADWKVVLRLILDENFQARLHHCGAVVPTPADLDSLLDKSGYYMSFDVGGVVLDCHFFCPEEIEFSFSPEDVTEATLRGLLRFMGTMGVATGRPVVMTPENIRESPLFSYDPVARQLSPAGRSPLPRARALKWPRR